MTDSNKICCFTGHRSIPADHLSELYHLLDSALEDLIARGVRTFRAGGAIGFDTIAALRVLSMKSRGADIRLELILPCRDQTRNWPRAAVLDYHFILDHADSVSYVTETYHPHCMLARDRALVEGSDFCIAYLTQNRGGTAYTVAYALKHHVELLNLGDFFLKSEKFSAD